MFHLERAGGQCFTNISCFPLLYSLPIKYEFPGKWDIVVAISRKSSTWENGPIVCLIQQGAINVLCENHFLLLSDVHYPGIVYSCSIKFFSSQCIS